MAVLDYKISILFCLFFFYILISKGQDFADSAISSPGASYYEMTIEELLQVKVVLATKTEKDNSIAPGSIISYTKKEIELQGAYSLKELANITPGYSTFSVFGETNIETRGQKADSWNVNKHVLLVDGIPVNHIRANSAPLEYQIPVFFADRVEFLKGPGSALFGTSAFYGAMYIKPQHLDDEGTEAQIRLSGGTIANEHQLLGNVIMKKPIGQLSLHVGYHGKGFSGDSIGVPNTDALYDNDNSVFIYTRFKVNKSALKGLTIGTIYMRKQSHGGEFWGGPVSPHNLLTWESIVPYLKYEKAINDKLVSHSFVKYNASRESAMTHAGRANRIFRPSSIPGQGYNILVSNIETQSELQYDFSDKMQLIAGVNYDTRKELGSPQSYKYDIAAPADTTGGELKNYEFNYVEHPASLRVNLFSVYAQYQHHLEFLEGTHLTAGARYDMGFSSVEKYSQLSPRIALVQKITKQISMKVLYGKALLVPGVKEYEFNKRTKNNIKQSGGEGNVNDIPDLDAESFESLEGVLEYAHKKFSVNVNAFANRNWGAMAFDQYRFVDAKGENEVFSYFSNSTSEITTKGFEAGLKIQPYKFFHLHLSHTYAKAKLNDTTRIVDVPTQTTDFEILLSLKGKFPLKAGLNYRHVWGFSVSDKYDKSALDITDDNILAGYGMLNLNLIFPITSFLNLELKGTNLLNSSWKQPSLKGQSSMIPLPERQFLFSLVVRI